MSSLRSNEDILSLSPALLSRDFRHPIIASFTFSKASSRVSPSERQPGRSGHSATYLPSSSFSMIMLNFMIVVTCLSHISVLDVGSKEKRIELFGERLLAISEELKKRDLSEISTPKLFEMMVRCMKGISPDFVLKADGN